MPRKAGVAPVLLRIPVEFHRRRTAGSPGLSGTSRRKAASCATFAARSRERILPMTNTFATMRRMKPAARTAWLVWLFVLAIRGGHAAEFTDAFAGRQLLPEASGSLAGSNIGATREAGEPEHADKAGGSSVWVSWLAPTNGIATFRTAGSSFDTLLAAYYIRDSDAPTLDNLREAASNDDDSGTEPASYIQFAAKAGRRYEIAVDGYRGATGAVALAWSFVDINTQPPIVVSVPGDQAVRLGDPVTLTVNFETSPDARLQWRFNGDSFGEEGPTLFIPSLQATNVGRYSLRVRIGDDRFETTPVEIQINSEGQTNALARDKILDALDSRLTPDDDDSPEVEIESAAKPFGPTLMAAAAAAVLANPGVSRGYNGSQIFNTIYATPDPNEPQHCGVAGGASYWFAYEAPTNGTLHVDTIGSSFDTLLAAYGVTLPATGYDSLVSLACDNDSVAPLGASRIAIPVVAGGRYLIVVDGVAGAKGLASLNYLLETRPAPDLQPPTIRVTSPARPSSIVTTNRITLRGTALDNVAVSNVFILAGNGEPILASGTTEWSAEVPLHAGTNRITIAAQDTSGNTSAPLARVVTWIVRQPLTLVIAGEGTISGAVDQQALEVGRNYFITARPRPGHVFRGWTGGVTGVTERLGFQMEQGLSLTATFTPSPFIPFAGTFSGLFFRTNAFDLDSSGLLGLELQGGGAFSGRVRQANRRVVFSGKFDAAGHAVATLTRAGTSPMQVTLDLDWNTGASITCVLSNAGWTAAFSVNRHAFNARLHPATDHAGRYTLLLPGAADPDEAPIGHGSASALVRPSGSVTVTGTLADGTAFSHATHLSENGGCPLFESLHRQRGLLLGTLAFLPQPDSGTDVGGTMHWLRPADAGRVGPATSFLLNSEVAGSTYVYSNTAPILGLDEARALFDWGNETPGVTNLILFGNGLRATNLGPAVMSLALSPQTGLFRGRLTVGESPASASFRGAMLQRQQMGGGSVWHTNRPGKLLLVP